MVESKQIGPLNIQIMSACDSAIQSQNTHTHTHRSFSVVFRPQRDRRDYLGRGAQAVHLFFHTHTHTHPTEPVTVTAFVYLSLQVCRQGKSVGSRPLALCPSTVSATEYQVSGLDLLPCVLALTFLSCSQCVLFVH